MGARANANPDRPAPGTPPSVPIRELADDALRRVQIDQMRAAGALTPAQQVQVNRWRARQAKTADAPGTE